MSNPKLAQFVAEQERVDAAAEPLETVWCRRLALLNIALVVHLLIFAGWLGWYWAHLWMGGQP